MRYEYESENRKTRENITDPVRGTASYSGRGGGNKKRHRRYRRLVASALIFGVLAGGGMYGVNYAGNLLMGSGLSSGLRQEAGEESAPLVSGTMTSARIREAGADLSVEEVAGKALPSLVTISTMGVQEMRSIFGGVREYQVEGAGSGIIIGENDSVYYIATNDHVVSGAGTVSVGFVDSTAAAAEIVGSDEENDLAVLAVPKTEVSDSTADRITVAEVGDSDSLNLGQQVVVIGNALGYGQSVTSGYVSALNRSLSLGGENEVKKSDGLIQTDAAINSGNSGGALLDMQGSLIGINEAKTSATSSGASVDNMGFAIPMSRALPILQELISAGSGSAAGV